MAGFSFGGNSAQKPALGGLGTTGGTGGFSLGGTSTTTTASTGFTLSTPATSATGGFSFSTPATSTGGFSLSTPATSATTGFQLGSLGAKTTGGLTLGTATSTPATGFGASTVGLGAAAPASTGGLTLGAPAASGFSFGKTTTATTTASTLGGLLANKPTLGGLGSTTTTSGTLSLGGLGQTSTAGGLTLGGGLALGGGLGQPATSTAAAPSKGLGGVDLKGAAPGGTTNTNSGKPSDNRAIKETSLPNDIVVTVENFKKNVKEQKSVREDISRISSKPLVKVQEEILTLKNLLSVVSNGLQRNASAIEKLKAESAQELKNAEIAQRTKDTPPGLQYENTAPIIYFQRLVADFESQMLLYRQQIEEMERNIVSLNQPSPLTPQELSSLLRKLHETFIALAAQLHTVHEVVKSQKEQYLNYRRAYHGDTTNIFENRKKTAQKTGSTSRVSTSLGPTPFTGMSNAAAVAMAAALNRPQQPTAATGLGAGTLGQPTGLGQATGLGQTGFGIGTGLGAGLGTSTGLGTTTGFGGLGKSTFGTGTTGLGASTTGFGLGSTLGGTSAPTTGFGAGTTTLGTGTGFGIGTFGTPATQQQTTGGFGSSFTFGNTAAVKPLGLGASTQQTTGLGAPQATGFGATALGTPMPSGGEASGFQLQKPPIGNKRGKKF